MCVGKEEFTNKSGKKSYVLHLVEFKDNNGYLTHRVHRAFTSKKHFDAIDVSALDRKVDLTIEGYLSFNNGFTHFYLPKEEVK